MPQLGLLYFVVYLPLAMLSGSNTPLESMPAGAPGAAPDGSQFRPIDEEVREFEKARMLAALQASNGNQTRAADLIKMPLRTFVAKLKQYGIQRRSDKR